MELKDDEVFLLRSDVSTRPSLCVLELLVPSDGRIALSEIDDLNILGMILSRDPAQGAATSGRGRVLGSGRLLAMHRHPVGGEV